MSLAPFVERVRRGMVVADGAWGSMLLARGLATAQPPEAWTLDRPDQIAALAREYLEAGAEIITTNTFGGSPLRLRQHGLEARVDEINRRAVELIRDAVKGRAYVSASVGPCGLMLQPLGVADPAQVEDGFRRQIEALAFAGADVICIETMTDLAEATIAVRAARAVAPSLPIIATMTFDLTRRGPFTMMGVSVEQAVGGLTAAGADVVGANCGNGVEAMQVVAAVLRQYARVPVAVRPNAGLPEQRGSQLVYLETPEQFAAAATAIFESGIAIVGGCCGTTPDHIRALAHIRGSRDPGGAR